MKQAPETWAEYVEWVLAKHGATLRSQRIRTGLAHSTLMNWLSGVEPQMNAVVAFARGFGEDVNAALRLAGYEPPDVDPATWFKAQAFDLYQLAERLGITFRAGWFHGGSESAIETREQAQDALRRRVELLIEDYPEHTEALRGFLGGG